MAVVSGQLIFYVTSRTMEVKIMDAWTPQRVAAALEGEQPRPPPRAPHTCPMSYSQRLVHVLAAGWTAGHVPCAFPVFQDAVVDGLGWTRALGGCDVGRPG